MAYISNIMQIFNGLKIILLIVSISGLFIIKSMKE